MFDNLAGRWERLGAVIIDAIIGALIMLPIFWLTGYWNRLFAGEQSPLELMLWAIVGSVLWLVLHGRLLTKNGQTIGKQFVGIRMISVENREVLPLWKYFVLRYIPQSWIPAIPFIGGLFGLVDICFIFRQDRRCVHDLIAGTIVVKDHLSCSTAFAPQSLLRSLCSAVFVKHFGRTPAQPADTSSHPSQPCPDDFKLSSGVLAHFLCKNRVTSTTI